MANMLTKLAAAYFDTKGIKYDLRGDNEEAIVTGFRLDNKESQRIVVVFYPEENESCSIKVYEVVKVPKEKIGDVLIALNHLNNQFRWIKFSLDEEDLTVNAADDCVLTPETCGEEVYRCCMQMVSIIDEAYPTIMKAMWG